MASIGSNRRHKFGSYKNEYPSSCDNHEGIINLKIKKQQCSERCIPINRIMPAPKQIVITFGWLSFRKMRSEKMSNGIEANDWSVLDSPIKDLVPPISSKKGKVQKIP
jgi:hypothetical protein